MYETWKYLILKRLAIVQFIEKFGVVVNNIYNHFELTLKLDSRLNYSAS